MLPGREGEKAVVLVCVVISKYNSLGCGEEARGPWLTARATWLLLCFQKLYVDRAKLTWKSTVHSYMFSSESILSEIRLTANRAPVALCEKRWRTLTYLSVSRQIIYSLRSKGLLCFALFSFLLLRSLTVVLFRKWW